MADHTILLLVDDEECILHVLEDALTDAGYTVLTASNGAEAISVLNDGGNTVAGLITDIRIGDYTNGWDVARHARGLEPTLPVVYMSGDSVDDWTSHGVPDSAILQKPFAAARLITTMSKLLNEVAKTTAE